MIAALISSLHLLALAIGLPAVFLRGRALKGPLDADGLRRLLAADNVWGIAAVLWIATGLLRAFGGLEKGTEFYLRSPLFWTKMALFGIVFLLEIRPMVTFIRWRRALRQGLTGGHERRADPLHAQPHRAGHRRGDGVRGQSHGSRGRLLGQPGTIRPRSRLLRLTPGCYHRPCAC
jgi:putative membrane protein